MSRAVLFVATYLILPRPAQASDLSLFYFPQARLVFGGAAPYRDFPTSYGPLFPYLSASLFFLGESQAAVAVVMIGFDVASLLLLASVLRSRENPGAHGVSNLLVYLYTINPVSAYWAGVTAYNGSIILFFWLVAAILIVKGRAALSVLAGASSVLLCKLLGALGLPVFLLHRKMTVARACLGFALPAAVLLFLASRGLDVFLPLKREALQATSANVWFLLSGLLSLSSMPPVWRLMPFVAICFGVGALLANARRATGYDLELPGTLALLCGINLVFLLLSRKSCPFYLLMFTLFLCFVSARFSLERSTRTPFAMLMLLGVLSVFESLMWVGIGQSLALGAALADRSTRAAAWSLATTDVAMVACYVYFLWLSVQTIGAVTGAQPAGRTGTA